MMPNLVGIMHGRATERVSSQAIKYQLCARAGFADCVNSLQPLCQSGGGGFDFPFGNPTRQGKDYQPNSDIGLII